MIKESRSTSPNNGSVLIEILEVLSFDLVMDASYSGIEPRGGLISLHGEEIWRIEPRGGLISLPGEEIR